MRLSKLLCYLGIHLHLKYIDEKEMIYICEDCGYENNIYYV